ncbi:MAG: glycosyltransferase family 4 protein [bacterium]
MRIVQIIPSSGNSFYCQNCQRDSSLVKALRSLGHDALIVPLYLPLSTDYAHITGDAPLFYGAINAYLKQISPLFRKMPRWMERLFNSPLILRRVAKRAGSTRARGLEQMTISMLKGEYGHQASELDKLVSWLKHEGKPDIVHLSNALLLGVARQIRKTIHVPIVCSLQDEDYWINAMDTRFIEAIWELLSERARDVDMFIAVSHYYARLMKKCMRLPADKVAVVYIGIDLDGYNVSSLSSDVPVIGYLSRITKSLGFGILVDAFMKLKKDTRFKHVKLRAAGGYSGDDMVFLTRVKRRLAAHNLLDAVEIMPHLDREGRLSFLQSLSLLSVPAPEGEAFGLYQIEALAAGVPIVQPKAGAFPEIIKATEGGIVYEPNDADTLACTCAALLLDPEKMRTLGERGRYMVSQRFTIYHMADTMVKIYEQCMKNRADHVR